MYIYLLLYRSILNIALKKTYKSIYMYIYKKIYFVFRNMTFYYAGFNTSMLFSNNGDIIFIVDSFTKVPFSGITGFQIGWNYFLIWKGKELYISQKFEENSEEADSNFQLIQPLEKPLDRYI